jgi:hypothetical protein
MHGFILKFHNTKFYFISLVINAMKRNFFNANFKLFHFLETMYTQFHLDQTIPFSLFINSFSCHQKIIYASSFIENKTPVRSNLTACRA